jgi:hypothetical protein
MLTLLQEIAFTKGSPDEWNNRHGYRILAASEEGSDLTGDACDSLPGLARGPEAANHHRDESLPG